jgi:hypothetical protein
LGIENSLRGSILELISEKEFASLNSVTTRLLTVSAKRKKDQSEAHMFAMKNQKY